MFHLVKKIFLFFIFGLLTMSYAKHEEYYSLTNIQYKETEKTLQITMRLFTDDLEKTLEKNYGKNFELNTEREVTDAQVFIEKYIKSKFNISINGNMLNYVSIGNEYEKDSIYIYLEISNIEKFSSIQIRNATLIDTFPSQENIVKIKAFGTYKSLILTYDTESGSVSF